MNWFDRFRAFLFSHRFGRRDAILIAVLLPCLTLLCVLWRTGAFDARLDYAVSQGYQARYQDGYVYLLDSGHSTLTKAAPDGRIVYRLTPGVYIDGFRLGEDGSVVLNGSSFSGMVVVGERILRIDPYGRRQSTLAAFDYGEQFISKHALHGVTERGGVVHYVRCGGDELTVNRIELSDGGQSSASYAYPNAFNAVSDAAFDGERLYVLDRSGVLNRLEPDGSWKTVYDAGASGESGRVPYRLETGPDGAVYFTDVRSRTVQRVLPDGGGSETVIDGTDSVTAGVSQNGNGPEFALTAGDTLWFPGGELTTLRSPAGAMLLPVLAWLLAALCCPLGLVLLLRLLAVLLRRQRSALQQTTLATVCVGMVAVLVTGSILLGSFMDAYEEKINEELLLSAYSTAHQLRVDDVLGVNAAADYNSEAYRRICAAMDGVFDRSVPFNRNAYCNILRHDESGAYCIAYLDGTIGTYYPLDDFETEQVVEVYSTGAPVVSDAIVDVSGIYFGVKVPITDEARQCVGVVSVGTQVSVLRTLLRDMVMRVLTSVLILAILIWIIASEMIAYARNLNLRRQEMKERSDVLPAHTLRVLLVLIFAAYNLEAAFLPAYIVQQLDERANAELLGSLPYTVNIFIIGVTALFCAGLVRRAGVRRILFLSFVSAGVGNLLIFSVEGYPSVLAGMALIGVGVGLATNAIYAMLTYVRNAADQVWGLSVYNAAVMAGINLGMAGGSVLAVLLGRRAVFGICAGLWLLILLLSGRIVRQLSGTLSIPGGRTTDTMHGGFRTLFGNRIVPAFVLCIQNPYILFSSFAMYFVPIFCAERGYSETTVSLLLLCYAQISIFAGDSLTGIMQRRLGAGAMYTALGLNIAALLAFGATRSLAGLLAALLLLGLSASYGKPVQQKYFMNLPQVKAYGEDRAMGVYNFTENIGESAGPVVMAWVLSRTPVFPAVAGFCGIVALLGAFHAVSARFHR